MGKGQKGSFFASDDKAENHINEGEGKKILRARKMKGRSRREQPRPSQGFSSHFSKAKSLGQGWRREKKQGLHY